MDTDAHELFVDPETAKATFLDLRTALDGAMRNGGANDAMIVVRALGEQVAKAVAKRDLGEMATIRAQLVRIQRRVKAADTPDAELSQLVLTKLETFDELLDTGRVAALMLAAHERNASEVGILRDRVLEVLRRAPERPRRLAELFSADPSQISRALRELRDSGEIVIVPPPEGSDDQRAHWYAAHGVGHPSPRKDRLVRGVARVLHISTVAATGSGGHMNRR